MIGTTVLLQSSFHAELDYPPFFLNKNVMFAKSLSDQTSELPGVLYLTSLLLCRQIWMEMEVQK